MSKPLSHRLRKIVLTVSEYYKLTLEELTGTGRRKEISGPRQVAMYLCRIETDASYPEIAEHIGGRDHTTIMYGYETIKDRLKQEEQLRHEIAELQFLLLEDGKKSIQSGLTEELKEVVVYTYANCENDPGVASYGVLLQFGQHEKELSQGYRFTTKQRIELIAAITGLEALKMQCMVILYVNSQLIVRAVTDNWMQMWQQNEWKKASSAVSNVELWQRLLELCEYHQVNAIWDKKQGDKVRKERVRALSVKAIARKHLAVDEVYEESMVH